MMKLNLAFRTVPNSKIPRTIIMTDFVKVGNIPQIFCGLNVNHDLGIQSNLKQEMDVDDKTLI